MRDALDMTQPELVAFIGEVGEKRFRADQLFQWLHARGARSFDEMSDLGRPLRARLGEKLRIGSLAVDTVQTSADGTRKLRLRTHDGRFIESVIIPGPGPGPGPGPDGDKTTQCI